MSEFTGPFDAAISFLTHKLESRGPGSERDELKQAIRVLEAAGKIAYRRELILGAMDNIHEEWGRMYEAISEEWGSRNIIVNLTRGLIEALPDGGKK
jgi:hypothetical protein